MHIWVCVWGINALFFTFCTYMQIIMFLMLIRHWKQRFSFLFAELQTPDELVYKFYPVAGGVFNFKIRAPNDAHLALTSGPSESDPMLEVFLGGWGNTKSVIRRNRTKPDVVEVETPNILNAGEFRGFWVRWFNGVRKRSTFSRRVPF